VFELDQVVITGCILSYQFKHDQRYRHPDTYNLNTQTNIAFCFSLGTVIPAC